MKLRLVNRVFCSLALAFAMAPLLWAANGNATKPAVDLRRSPTEGQGPVDVSVGLYITNFVAIDETRETFEKTLDIPRTSWSKIPSSLRLTRRSSNLPLSGDQAFTFGRSSYR